MPNIGFICYNITDIFINTAIRYLNMKKIILASLVATLALTACNQKDDKVTTEVAKTEEVAMTSAKEQDHEHDHDHENEHDHDHEHGDAYQCGDKAVEIAVHNHEGEYEVHLTTDGITYDLDQDPQDKNRYVTDDGIEGENKAMTLIIDGNKAQLVGTNNKTLLDCTKS